MDSDISYLVSYPCPRCGESLQARTDDWQDWLKCPSCGKATIGRSKEEYGGGYFCNKNNGGCGSSFKKGSEGARELDGQQSGPVENPDPFDLANTLLKMAKKRSLIDATLQATRSSDLFTQDVEPESPVPAQAGPRRVTTDDRAKAALNAVADMSEAHKTRAKQLAASMGAEKVTVRSLLATSDALVAIEDWIANGAELPVSAVPDRPEGTDGIYAASPKPTVLEAEPVAPAEHVVTMREAFPSAFESDGSRPSAPTDYSDEPFLLMVDALVPGPWWRVRNGIL